MAGFRQERLGILIQEKIGALIVAGKIKDPRVHTLLSITRVNVSGDLAWADVYVSNFSKREAMNGEAPHGDKAVAGLQSAAAFIQSTLARDLHTRLTPKLRFHEDNGLREGFCLIQRIDEVVCADSASGGAEQKDLDR